MNEDREDRAEFAAWINEASQIVTFRQAEGFEKRTFRTQEEKMSCVCYLCESGYRIL